MNNHIKTAAFFIVGSTAGFLLAWKLLANRYERLAQEEIDSVKEHFHEREADNIKKSTDAPCKSEKVSYSKRIEPYGGKEQSRASRRPHIISPDAFGDQDGYDQISLTYYSDKTLADDKDHAMDEDEIEETVGKESLTHFGEYEEDSVFVRNDRLKADYEILMDSRTYAEILKEKPYLGL